MSEPAGGPPRVGVLVIQVEAAAEHLLIRVTVNRNVNRELFSARPEPPLTLTDARAALAVAAEFLDSFQITG